MAMIDHIKTRRLNDFHQIRQATDHRYRDLSVQEIQQELARKGLPVIDAFTISCLTSHLFAALQTLDEVGLLRPRHIGTSRTSGDVRLVSAKWANTDQVSVNRNFMSSFQICAWVGASLGPRPFRLPKTKRPNGGHWSPSWANCVVPNGPNGLKLALDN
jgi:hypothetical protein